MKYLITLEPIEPYFFGGDRTFGNDSYIAYSRKFPQQTAILGMLRKEILVKEKVLVNGKIINEDKRNVLIGKDNFSMDKKEKNYGMIHSISEVFLWKDKPYYLVKDFFKYEVEFNPYFLKGYSAKEGIGEVLVSDEIIENNFFEMVMQVGNQKKKKEDAFFKKFSYKLKEFKFAFEVDTIYEIEKLDGNIVNLGGEKSKFKLNVIKEYKKEVSFPKRNFKYLVLLSDAYISKEYANFGITSEITFTFNKIPGKFSIDRENIYYFYEKGSVFIDYDDKLIEELNSFKNLTQIGYNKFKEIK